MKKKIITIEPPDNIKGLCTSSVTFQKWYQDVTKNINKGRTQ